MGVIGQLAGASTTVVADWATGVVEAAGRCVLPGCTGTEVLPQPPISSAASSAIPTIETYRCIRPSFRASSTFLLPYDARTGLAITEAEGCLATPAWRLALR